MATMEQYAKKRGKQIKPKAESVSMPAMISHDARYDFDTLTRAEEVKRDKVRHRAAKAHAKVQRKHIDAIVGGKKRRARES